MTSSQSNLTFQKAMENCLQRSIQELEELSQGADRSAYFPVAQIVQEGESAIIILREIGAEVDPGLKARFHDLAG